MSLSFSEIDNIVTTNLDCLDKRIYQYIRDPRGQSILYTITKNNAFLGCYQISSRADGGVRYNSIQGDGPEWSVIWETMLFTAIKRAEGTLTPEMEQDLIRRQEYYRQQLAEENVGKKDGSGEMTDHRGRKSQYSQEERDNAVIGWENRPSSEPQTLIYYLTDCFGSKDDDFSLEPKPNVSRAAFYKWRKDYMNRNSKK